MMLHEISPHRFHNEYFPYTASEGDLFVGVSEGGVLAAEANGEMRLPDVGEVTAACAAAGEPVPALTDFRYLARVDDTRFFTLTDRDIRPFGAYTYQNMRWLRVTKPLETAFAASVGVQLHNWYRRTRFCGSCGMPLLHAENERMMYCPACGEMFFPQICPSVIVAVRDGERILLTKYSPNHFPKSTHNPRATYALVAGYVEIGETPEQCVEREVMEEVGLRVKNITPWKNQPWPFTTTLLFGFFCDLDGSDRITLQEDELAVAEWVRREDMEDRSADISLTSNMMEAFRLGQDPGTHA